MPGELAQTSQNIDECTAATKQAISDYEEAQRLKRTAAEEAAAREIKHMDSASGYHTWLDDHHLYEDLNDGYHDNDW